MKSTAPNCERDEIEILDEGNIFDGVRYARVRVREPNGKASIFLTADQLEEVARLCLIGADKIRK